MEYDLGVTVLCRLIAVHDDQVLPAEVVGQRVGRIDGEGGPSDDEYICFRKCRYGVLPGFVREGLFVECDVRAEHASAGTVRNGLL